MRPRFSNQKNAAMTLVEVLVVIVVLAVLVAMLLPALIPAKHPSRLYCVSSLKEIGLAYRLWEQDNNDKYPMFVSVTNGGAMELIANGNVAACFQVMSNELSTPKILVCPEDADRIAATNFTTDFNNSRISYFVGLDVTNEINPRMLLCGDDNFVVDGVPTKSGLMQFSMNSNVAWASGRHISYDSHFWTPAHDKFVGNIGLADGSVQDVTTEGLQNALRQTGVATNRLAIP
jgi:prepilin-type N-terminal cleavage/methylation domain-containing protein